MSPIIELLRNAVQGRKASAIAEYRRLINQLQGPAEFDREAIARRLVELLPAIGLAMADLERDCAAAEPVPPVREPVTWNVLPRLTPPVIRYRKSDACPGLSGADAMESYTIADTPTNGATAIFYPSECVRGGRPVPVDFAADEFVRHASQSAGEFRTMLAVVDAMRGKMPDTIESRKKAIESAGVPLIARSSSGATVGKPGEQIAADRKLWQILAAAAAADSTVATLAVDGPVREGTKVDIIYHILGSSVPSSLVTTSTVLHDPSGLTVMN